MSNTIPGTGSIARARSLLTASARSDVPPFMVMDVMAAAARIEAAGGHVIHMEVGQPAAPAPQVAIEAAQAALTQRRIEYTSALGTPSLRARIARHYRDTYGCTVDPERIVVTTGSSGAFILAFLALFEPGDRVAVTVPGYPPYRHILKALGCEPVLIETHADTRHALTGEALLEAHRKTPLKGVLVASPANPTGTMMSKEALTGLMQAADGAFYLYADVSKFTSDSFDFASQMLEQTHVAATPGNDFDPIHGRAYVRFSYAQSAADMHEAVARIGKWLGQGGPK